MKDKPGKDKPSDARQKRLLGKIPPGPFDKDLEQAPERVSEPQPSPASEPEPVKGLGGLRRSKSPGKRLPAGEVAGSQGRAGESAAGAREDALVLPEGALVAMRKSGGFRFTSRGVVVYPNGQVQPLVDGSPRAAGLAASRKLSDEELAELYRALDRANLSELPATIGRQSPDAYAYEIVARTGTGNRSVETFDGDIPGELAPLIQLLTGYMTPGEGAENVKRKT